MRLPVSHALPVACAVANAAYQGKRANVSLNLAVQRPTCPRCFERLGGGVPSGLGIQVFYALGPECKKDRPLGSGLFAMAAPDGETRGLVSARHLDARGRGVKVLGSPWKPLGTAAAFREALFPPTRSPGDDRHRTPLQGANAQSAPLQGANAQSARRACCNGWGGGRRSLPLRRILVCGASNKGR